MAELILPQSLRPGLPEHPLQLGTHAPLGEALQGLQRRCPEVLARFWDGARLMPGFFMFRNQQLLDPRELAALSLGDSDQLRLVQPLSGG